MPVVRESKTEPNITLKMCDAEAAIRKQIDERRAEIDQIRCARIVHARRIEAAREELRKVEVELAAEREAFDHEFGSADNEKSDDAAKPAPPVETPIAVIPPTLEEIHAKGMKIRQLPDMDLMALASAHTAKEIAAAFGMNASYISKYVREVRNRNGVKRVVKQPRGNHPRFFHKLTRAEWDWLFDQALRNPPKNIIRIVDGQSQRVPKSFVFPELP